MMMTTTMMMMMLMMLAASRLATRAGTVDGAELELMCDMIPCPVM